MRDQPMKQRRGRSVRATAIVSVLALSLLAASFALRAEVVARAPVERWLADVAAEFDGTVAFDTIRPVGLTGVAVDGIRFVPAGLAADAVPVMTADRIVVDLSARDAFRGELGIDEVLVERPRIALMLDSEGGGHTPWVSRLVDRIGADPDRAGAATGDSLALDAAATPLRGAVKIRGGHVALEDPAGRYPSFGVVLHGVELRPEEPTSLMRQGVVPTMLGFSVGGDIEVEGLGRAQLGGSIGGHDAPTLRLHMLEDHNILALLPPAWRPAEDAALSVGRIDLVWPPALELDAVTVRQLNLPLPIVDAWRIDEGWAASLRVELDRDDVSLGFRDIRLEAVGLIDQTQLRLSRGTLVRDWSGATQFAELILVDGGAGQLAVRADEFEGGAAGEIISLSLRGDRFDTATIAPLMREDFETHLRGGEFDGELLLEWDRVDERLSGYALGQWTDGSLHAPVLSSELLEGIDADIDISFDAWPALRRIETTVGSVRVGKMPLVLRVGLEASEERFFFDADISLALTSAQSVLESLPEGLTPALDGFELGGDFGFDARFFLDSEDPARTVADVKMNLETLRVERFGPQAPLTDFLGNDFLWEVSTFEGTRREIGPARTDWTGFEGIPLRFVRAVVAAEDDGFWSHDGFDWRAITGSLVDNVRARRIVRGGSTISQQVVKNLFLSHDRTLSRKLQEAFLTWQMEQHLPKRRIFELYMNLCHWGSGVYGIHDASLAYFDHVPRRLTLRESAFLAAILPNPALFGEQYTRGIIPPSRRLKMHNILQNMGNRGYVDPDSLVENQRRVARGEVSATPPPTHLGPTPEPPPDHTAAYDRRAVRRDALLFLP